MPAPSPRRLLRVLLTVAPLLLVACGRDADAQGDPEEARRGAFEAQSAFVELQVGLPDGLSPGDETSALALIASGDDAYEVRLDVEAAAHFHAAQAEYIELALELTEQLARRLDHVRAHFEAYDPAVEYEGDAAALALLKEDLDLLTRARAQAEGAATEGRYSAAIASYVEAERLLVRIRSVRGDLARMTEIETKAAMFKGRLEAALAEAGLTPTAGRIPAALAGYGDGLAAKERGDHLGASAAFGLAAEDFEDLVGDVAELEAKRAGALEARRALDALPRELGPAEEAARARLEEAEAARTAGLLADAVTAYDEAREGLLALLDGRR